MDKSVSKDAPPPFAPAEYAARLQRLQGAIGAAGMEAVLLTTEAPFRYWAGFQTETWASPTRPRFLIVPRRGDPVAVVPTSNKPVMAAGPVRDIRAWQAPQPEDEGVSVLVDALRERTGGAGVVGVEMGPETRLGMPLADFFALRDRVAPISFADAGPLLAAARRVKSPAEVARIRHVAQIVSTAFEALPGKVAGGMSERDIARRLQADILMGGADKVQFMAVESGPAGYDRNITFASDRVLGAGDLLFIDTGSTYDGYWCDFDRHVGFGRLPDEVHRAYALVHRATDAGIAAVRPGLAMRDVWRAMAAVLEESGSVGSVVGRMGHGLVLLVTEPPSMSATDETVLEPGMVITIEPSIAYGTDDGRGGRAGKIMLHEENVVVTGDGCELLSRRAPPAIPMVA